MQDYSKYEDFYGLLLRFFDYMKKEYEISLFLDKEEERIFGIYSYFGPKMCLKEAISLFINNLEIETYTELKSMTPEQLDIYLTLRGY